ncbi:MAG: hypothetical protein COA96_00940 [SAR86 cluster bacterium]|uniref:DUF560 domain-containing protein n=1 Tax=SAR86 cluster bacterium TaxID=2030880 RepID=A0A2A5BAS2_9GAMM|nr:MAG: hypothetical protein COA96_00940 [SAR86 cluster bacterium]
MKKHHQILLPIVFFCFQSAVLAAENDPPPNAEMDLLITAQQYQEAYDLGAANLGEWEGEPEFDFLYGLAALESGNPNESVFALERVAATSTDAVLRERARLELARAYFVTNNLTASENLFNAVLETNPPQNVQQNIQAFLQLIEARQNAQSPSVNWSLSSIIGNDDNINSATDNGLIDTPLIGQIELNQDGQQTDDSFTNTTVSMAYKYPFTRNRSLDLTVNLMHLDNFTTDQFDIDNLRGEVAYNWGDEVNRFKHGLTASKVNLDQNGFQKSFALNSSWQHAGNNGWYQSISGSYTQVRYDTSNGGTLNDLRDVDQVLITGGLTKIAGAYTHSLNLYHADESPEAATGGDHNGREFTGLAYSVMYRLNAQHTPYLRASVQDVNHDSEHPVFFNTKRSDNTESITLGWFWQAARNLMVTGEAGYTDNDSDIVLFDYSKFKYQVGFRYQF